jgi:hypothetical protein
MTLPESARERLYAAARPRPASPWLIGVFSGLAALGAGTFAVGIGGSEPLRAWQAYLVNFVFWTGLAAGGVLFSAILTITHAHWGRSLKRLAEAPGLFLVVALPLLAGLYPARNLLFSWIAEPLPEKAAWLNAPFLFLRDGGGLLLLTAVAAALLIISVRRDRQLLAVGGRGYDPVREQGREGQAVVFANIYGILYFLILSLLAFDLIMSLEPHWHSTLFGAYYLVGSFFTALAALFILAILAVRRLGLAEYITPVHFGKLGKLLLGFCLMTGDFFYTQFLVIWYGNLPEETGFIIERIRFAPWRSLSLTVLFGCFILPFVILLSSRVKLKLPAMLALCTMILAGMWLERFLLVAPSLWPGTELPIGFTEVAITAGYFGIMALCVLFFLGRFPLLPVADPLYRRHLGLEFEGGTEEGR